jgi:raffinose/stachyose/melibiose transport system permease protein
MSLHRYTRRTLVRELVLLLIGGAFAVPFYIVVVLSLKTNQAIGTSPLSFPIHPQWSNYRDMWRSTSGGLNVTIARSLVNNIVITAGSVALIVLLGASCGYVLARRRSKVSTGVYFLFLAGIVIPFWLGLVPIYVELRKLHLIGTYLGMIVLNVGLLTPLAVFLYTGFIRTLPREYEEAAQVDGAGMFRTLFRVVLPLLKPITGTVVVLAGLSCWNDFFLPLIYLSGSKNQTLPVAVYQFVGNETYQWNLIFPTVIVALAPIMILYLFIQKTLIKGFTGGIRG